MKQLFLNCCFLLLVGQLHVYGSPCFQTDDVNPLIGLRASLTIRVNIYFGDEDEEAFPIETDFYLLDESIVKILKTGNFQPVFLDGKQHKIIDEDYLEAAAQAFTSQDDEEAELVTFLIRKAISKHQESVIKTNYLGRGNFKTIKTGNFYLFGVSRTEDEVFVWHLPIEIKSGKNLIEIDQHNAEVVFSIDD